MTDWTTALLIGLVCGAVIGTGLMRYSLKEKPIYGGSAAHGLHYLACAFIGSMTPFIFASIFVGVDFLPMFGTALSFLGLAALMTFFYGIVENGAETPTPSGGVTPQLD